MPLLYAPAFAADHVSGVQPPRLTALTLLPFVRSPATSIALIVLSPVALIVVNFIPAYVIWRSTSVSTCGRLANGRGCTATAATSRGRFLLAIRGW